MRRLPWTPSGVLALLLTTALLMPRASANPVLIEEYYTTNGVLITDNTLTNGETYQLRLKLDFTSNDVSNIKVRSGDWAISVKTQFVNFVTSSIPIAAEDFWGGYVMYSAYNYVDSTLNGTFLDDNSRGVNVSDGPTNRAAYIEDLWFTTYAVTTTTNVAQNRLFSLGGVHFYDTSGNDYNIGASGTRKLTLMQPYMNIVNVIPEPTTVGLGALGLGAFYLRRFYRKLRT